MKSLTEIIRDIYRNDRRVILWLIGLMLMGVVIVVITVINLTPGVADGTTVRYSDSGGYDRGEWWYMLGFMLMGLALVVLHPLVSVRVYEKRGASVAVMMSVASIALALVVLLTLMRLVGEG